MAVADTDINIAELTENGGGGGGVLPDLVQEITYNDLKQKRDNGTLMVGVWYRITDYRATTSQEYTKAAGKRFDILALAVSANQLNEECKVAEHRGSDDFEGRDLSAWKIWYRLDNDPKFAWWCDGEMYRTQKYGYDLVMKYVGTSDEEPGYQHKFFSRLEGSYISVFAKEKSGSNIDVKIVYPTWDTTDRLNISYIGNIEGRGIVYRMIDEFDNDLPYDFQNMQFARNKIITHNVSEFVGSYAVYKDGHSYNYTVDPETEYLFTFHNCFERKKEVCKNYFPPIYRNLNSNYEAFLAGNVFVESRCNCNEIKSDWFRDNTVNFGEFIGVTSLSASISENLIKKANNLTIRGSYFSYNNILSLTNLVSEFSFTNSNILGSSNIKANYTVEGITLNVDNLIVDTNIQYAYGDILSIPANDRRNKVAYRNPADPYDRNIMIRYTDDNQGSTAKDTTYDNSKSGLNANNTQDAIDELGENLGELGSDVNALKDASEVIYNSAENVASVGNDIIKSTNVQGVIAEISGKEYSTEVEVSITDFNDAKYWEVGGIITANGTTYTDSSRSRTKDFHRFTQDTILHLIRNEFELTIQIFVYCYDKDKNYIGLLPATRDSGYYISGTTQSIIMANIYNAYPSTMYIKLSTPNTGDVSAISSNLTFDNTIKEINESIVKENDFSLKSLSNHNILFRKKWCVIGDSFTYNGYKTEELTSECYMQDGKYKGQYRVYKYIIGNRNNMNIVDLSRGGRTMATPTSGATTNAFSTDLYKQIPLDSDYITIMLGINDLQSQYITIGDIDSTDIGTFYGSWNVVMEWIITNCPFAHIGILLTNGMGESERGKQLYQAEKDIAKKWNVPILDLNGDDNCPMMHRGTYREGTSQVVKNIRLNDFKVSETNTHPNWKAHEYESTFIENFLRRL